MQNKDFIYQYILVFDSYHPAIAPRKNTVVRLLKKLLIVDALLQQSMFKGFDFTLLSERTQI